MIITKILGGLGNQLFQYAAGKALALQNNTELQVDLSGFTDYRLRAFELSKFNVSFTAAASETINQYKATTPAQRVLSRLSPTSMKRFYKQPFFHFDPHFFSLRSPLYLQGYFQSEKYFAPVKEMLQKEFRLKQSFDRDVLSLAAKMREEHSVSVHLRRGDYRNAESLRVHGILSDAYYHKAVAKLKETVNGNLQFYIFSDDADAAKTLALPGAQIASGTVTKNHFEDFFLMQQCRHNIIANSSFSWWAAYLNDHANKTVIAPQAWFNEGPKDTQDLLPQTWIRL